VSHARTVRSLAACGVLLAAGAAGCTDTSARPKPLPSPSPSSAVASPTPSPSATPPSLPAEARGTSAAAAKAFVRHYIATVNYATATGDTSVLATLDDGSCDSCSSVISRVHTVYDAGGKIVSRGWQITSLSVLPARPKRPIVDAGLRLSPQSVIRQRGGQPEHFRGGRLPVTFRLVLGNQGWRVDEWARAA
jgi:hypothetical protein